MPGTDISSYPATPRASRSEIAQTPDSGEIASRIGMRFIRFNSPRDALHQSRTLVFFYPEFIWVTKNSGKANCSRMQPLDRSN